MVVHLELKKGQGLSFCGKPYVPQGDHADACAECAARKTHTLELRAAPAADGEVTPLIEVLLTARYAFDLHEAQVPKLRTLFPERLKRALMRATEHGLCYLDDDNRVQLDEAGCIYLDLFAGDICDGRF